MKTLSNPVVLKLLTKNPTDTVPFHTMCINASTPAWTRVRHWSAPAQSQLQSNEDKSCKNPDLSRLPWECPLTLEDELSLLNIPFTGNKGQDLAFSTPEDKFYCPVPEQNDVAANHSSSSQLPKCIQDIYVDSDIGQMKALSSSLTTLSPPNSRSKSSCLNVEYSADSETHSVLQPQQKLKLQKESLPNCNDKCLCVPESSTQEFAACDENLLCHEKCLKSSYCSDYLIPCSFCTHLASHNHSDFGVLRSKPMVKWKKYQFKPPWVPNLSVLLSLVMVLLSFHSTVEARICKSMLFKTKESMEQLRGCSVVEGNLVLSLGIMDQSHQTPRSKSVPDLNVTFPDLREITDYLMIYESKEIPRLTNIFPNLTVIRGDKLLEDWALIVYKNPDLEEIGLTGLTKILRGGVRIARNKKLCYVNTINWEAITRKEFNEKNVIEHNHSENSCPALCPSHCPILKNIRTSCWNENTCQRIQVDCPNNVGDRKVCYQENGSNTQVRVCNKECIGGCSGKTQENCFSCRHVFFQGQNRKRCQNVCPAPFLKFKNWRCVTREECSQMKIQVPGESIQDTVYFKAYEGECLEKCPVGTKEADDQGTPICKECKNCPSKCSGAVISSLNVLTRFESCTHIMGDLTIQITGSNVVQDLTKYLGQIREISGSLKIARTFAIVSLDFFQNLQYIRGKNLGDAKAYSIRILENENLQQLFPTRNGKTVKILRTDANGTEHKGRAFIHYNARLCKKEIKQLLKEANMLDSGENSADISYATNGNKAICSSKTLQMIDILPSSKITYLKFENYQKTIVETWPESTVRTLLGYEVHYREISKVTFVEKNLTKFEGRDACGGDDWTVHDQQPTPEEAVENSTQMIFPDEVVLLPVKPYTYYAVYISTLLLKEYSGSQGVVGAESEINYFQTPQDIPGVPQSVKIEKINYQSVNVTWQEPAASNGIIDHYEVILEFNEIDPSRIIGSRPYCHEDYKVEKESPRPSDVKSPNKTSNFMVDGTCSCQNCGIDKNNVNKVSSKEDKLEEEAFHDAIINRVFDSPLSSGLNTESRLKRSIVASSMDNQFMKEQETNATDIITIQDNLERYPVIVDRRVNSLVYSYTIPYNRKKMVNGKPAYYLTYSKRVKGFKRHLFISNLKHYGSYTLKIRACQKLYETNQTAEKFCSKDVEKEVRVLHKPGADDILSGITPSGKNDTEDIWISWLPPQDPNEVIVNYNIRANTKSGTSNNNFLFRGCITAKDFQDNGYRYEFTQKGSFFISVQAVSVYGEGNWTDDLWITNPEQNHGLYYISIPVILVFLVGIVISSWLYIKRNKRESMLISTDNGGYISVRELYQAAEWEVDRSLVTVGEELGRGGFGKVHRGTYNHPTKGMLDVAIKTVQEGASYHTCIQFLVEAHTMKYFDTPHVVKLIGLVVQYQPHLVLLELMANGDLKNYLRSLRPDDPENTNGRPPPTVLEVKQMALEIVDGMAYLSTHHKHIVHRDLAARNCMVSGDLVVKIGDFGMAREIYTTDYYRKGNKGYMPVRWMAPESLKDGKFDSSSDVWSFGIVLWEMVTLAELPYKGYSNQQVVENVIKGRIMERPENCPDDLWQIMLECWQKRPSMRPTFLDLCLRLEPIANERFKDDSFILSPSGVAALQNQEEERRQMHEETEAREETPCLTGNGNSNSNGDAYPSAPTTIDNGHLQMSELQRQDSHSEPTATTPMVNFINPKIPRKWPINGLKKMRHKSGSTSGEP